MFEASAYFFKVPGFFLLAALVDRRSLVIVECQLDVDRRDSLSMLGRQANGPFWTRGGGPYSSPYVARLSAIETPWTFLLVCLAYRENKISKYFFLLSLRF